MIELPPGWRWSTVENVGRIDLGRQRHPDWHTGPEMRPYLRVANVFEDRIDTSDIKEMDFSGVFERYKLEPGEVLLNEGQSPELLGRPAIYRGVPGDVAFTNTLLRFRAGPDVYPEWALLVFRRHMHFGRFIREARITTNIAHLSASRLKVIEFPVPPLVEQWRIVELFESHLSRLDAAGKGLARALKGLDALRLSCLAHIREGLVRDDASLVPIGSFCETSLGKMLDAKRASGEPTPYLRNINVRWADFDLSHVRLVPLTEAERTRLRLRAGDIMVCEGGEPGRCAVWPTSDTDVTFQKALHRMRVRDELGANPHFVALMLEEFIRTGRASQLLTGTTIKHLPQEKLRLIELPLPTLELQRAAVAQVDELSVHIRRLRERLQRALAYRNVLRRTLLDAAFTGRLSGQASDIDMVEEMAGV